jgi:hypothetical protein
VLRRLGPISFASLAVWVSLAVPSAQVNGAQVSASSLLSQSLAAANESGSVRFTDQSTVGEHVQFVQGAISAPTASETLSGNSAPLGVELVGGNIYVFGNAIALESALAITETQATPAANKWILVKSTDAPFQDLSGTLTMSSTLDEFTPKGNLHLGAQRKIHGTKVIPITGTPSSLSKGTKGNASLLVRVSSPHLPVGGTLVLASKSGRLNEVAVFTAWGAKVVLTPPANPLPFTTVLSY